MVDFNADDYIRNKKNFNPNEQIEKCNRIYLSILLDRLKKASEKGEDDLFISHDEFHDPQSIPFEYQDKIIRPWEVNYDDISSELYKRGFLLKGDTIIPLTQEQRHKKPDPFDVYVDKIKYPLAIIIVLVILYFIFF